MPTHTHPSPASPARIERPPAPTAGRLVGSLARTEARRLLRQPVLVLGLLITAFAVRSAATTDWSGARYSGYVAALGGVLWAVSVAAVGAGARTRLALAEDAPTSALHRALGRMLGASALVALVAVLVAGAAIWLRADGGLELGDEPGRTEHAHYTVPELLQPVVLAALAAAVGLALGARLRHRIEGVLVATVGWFAVSALYWVFNAPALQPIALVQAQPVRVVLGSVTDPLALPGDWLLSRPGRYQDGWERLVVSPEIASWHVVYLVGLTVLAAAAAMPRGHRGRPALAGLVVAALGAAVQYGIWP